jgi:hypothetical protein
MDNVEFKAPLVLAGKQNLDSSVVQSVAKSLHRDNKLVAACLIAAQKRLSLNNIASIVLQLKHWTDLTALSILRKIGLIKAYINSATGRSVVVQ